MSTQTWVVINDMQIPFEDKPVLWDLVVPFIEELKPYGVVINGDGVDNTEISDYPKDPSLRRYDLKVERSRSSLLMTRLRKVTREAWWEEGNHEDRFRRYAWSRVPELVGAGMVPGFASAFRLEEHGFKHKPYNSHLMLGKLLVTHGFLVAQQSAFSAKRHFERLGTSVLIGHTHRGGVHYKRNRAGTHAAYENFCLCRLDGLGYATYPDWQQGFSVVTVFDGGLFNVTQIPILDRRLFMYGGTVVRRK